MIVSLHSTDYFSPLQLKILHIAPLKVHFSEKVDLLASFQTTEALRGSGDV